MVHKISVRPKPGHEGEITRGTNTLVYLDDQLLKGARFIKFEVDSRKVAKVTIELYAQIELEDAYSDLEVVELEHITDNLTLKKLKSKI